MASSPPNNNSSFIPKHNKKAKRRRKSTKQVFIFSIVVYGFLFSSLVASAALFLYERHLTEQLTLEVTELGQEISTFRGEDLARVREFDITLNRVANRVDNKASVVAVLEALQEVTAAPAQIRDFSLTRDLDTGFSLSGQVTVPNIDAAIFQRRLYNLNQEMFSAVTIEEVSFQPTQSSDPAVTFSFSLDVPLEMVPFDPAVALRPAQTIQIDATTSTLNTNTQPADDNGVSVIESTNI